MRYALRLVLGCSLFLFGTAGCAHSGRPGQSSSDTSKGNARQGATLIVQNQAFNDMNIFVMQGGGRVRLGMAIGNSTTRLQIPPYILSTATDLRFLADPIGGSHLPVTTPITVFPGDEVTMVIPPS